MAPLQHSISVLQELRKESNSIIISYSGGKDSLVVLDLCSKVFENVYCFFMYTIKDISFQKTMLDFAVKRYGVEIKQYPHPQISRYLKNNIYCFPSGRANSEQRILKLSDIYDIAREDFGAHYIAVGWKKNDSVDRRIVINQLPDNATDKKGKRLYPLANWSDKQIYAYMKLNKLPIPETLGIKSFDIELTYKVLSPLKIRYPDDYARVKRVFPLIDAVLHKGKLNENKTND